MDMVRMSCIADTEKLVDNRVEVVNYEGAYFTKPNLVCIRRVGWFPQWLVVDVPNVEGIPEVLTIRF